MCQTNIDEINKAQKYIRENSVVLCIGFSEYMDKRNFEPLPGVSKDLENVENAFGEIGYSDIRKLENKTLCEVLNAINHVTELNRLLTIVYWSGHGCNDNFHDSESHTALIAFDTEKIEINESQRYYNNVLAIEILIDNINENLDHSILFVFDTCHAQPNNNSFLKLLTGLENRIDKEIHIMGACHRDQESYSNPVKGSKFTNDFVDCLFPKYQEVTQRNGLLEMDSFCKNVTRKYNGQRTETCPEAFHFPGRNRGENCITYNKRKVFEIKKTELQPPFQNLLNHY